MQIILAAPRGFCAGVNMAIESLEIALARFGAPIFVYHEIVHNRWVVEHFRARGVVFVDCLEDVPKGANLLYSAHGVSPEIRRQAAARNLATIDATCPLVTKVHREAMRFAQEGYKIVLIGHQGHDEVIGTIGEAPRAIHVVGSVEDVDRLEFSATERLAYLTQTTLSVNDASRIIRRLEERFPHIEGPAKEDICYATQNRQEAVRLLANQADLVLVVGSRNSSNSQRLVEIARIQGVPAYLIDGPEDIRAEWFSGGETVVITAGASAPEGLVEQCVAWLQGHFQPSVRTHQVREENVRFLLPKELRG